jgi:MFS family permease
MRSLLVLLRRDPDQDPMKMSERNNPVVDVERKVEHRRWSLSRLQTFLAAACSLVFVFAAAGTPIPIYNIYRAENGITNGDLGLISVGYFVAAAASLLVFGRLSNHTGRRTVSIVALASAALSCVLLIEMQGVVSLLLARLLQGLACGLASTALGAYVVDTGPTRPSWLAAAITGSAPMLGIPIGAVASGALASFGPAPRTLVYVVAAAVLGCFAVLIALSVETRKPARGATASLRPRLAAPAGCCRLLFATGAGLVAVWSLGGFYQAFGPSIVADYLGTSSPIVTATAFSAVMVLAPLGGPLAARLSPTAGLRAGLVVFMAALVAIVFALRLHNIALFLPATLAVGLAQGIASTGGLRALLARARPDETSGLLSTLYLIGYSGAALPALVAGELTRTFDLFQIAIGYAALGTGASVIAILAMRKVSRARDSAGSVELSSPNEARC